MKIVSTIRVSVPIRVAKDLTTVIDGDNHVIAVAGSPTLAAWLVDAINSQKGIGYVDAPFVEDAVETAALAAAEPLVADPVKVGGVDEVGGIGVEAQPLEG
jgi:hypothetical protein